MAMTLVINGADYSSDYIEKVTFGNTPCTAIALNKASTTLANTTSTETLIATPTPSDTTDQITWASSDTDVVAVNNGVISAVGLGTATITVTCGQQTASCTVTCEGKVDFVYIVKGRIARGASGKDYLYLGSANDTFAVGIATGTLPATSNESEKGWLYPIVVPEGADTLVCRCMTQYWGIDAIYFMQSDVHASDNPVPCKIIASDTTSGTLNWGDRTYNGQACYGNDITLPTNIEYDSVMIRFKQHGSGDASETDAQNTFVWFEASA